MAEVKFKFIGDDSELRKKLANLAKIQSEMTEKFSADMSKSLTSGANSIDNKAQAVSVDDVRAATVRLKDAQLANIEALRQARIEAAKQKQEQAELNNKFAQGKIDAQEYALAQKKITTEQKEQARQARELKKQLADGSEYGKLARALNNVRKETKDVLAEMFRMERQGHANTLGYEALRKKSEALTKQTLYLDNGIKRIDATLGQHQRNVGNYAGALETVVPIIGRVNSQLADLGVSLDDLANKPGAIKEVGTSFMAMGNAILSFVLTPVGLLITAITAFYMLFKGNKQTVIDFNNGLLNVGKTTGLAGVELQGLSDSIIKLSRSLKTVSTDKLLEYATVAGQLGVKGSANILAFSEALAKLETASDISGEQGGAEIARMLTLVDGGVQNVKAFGDEIVNLGNNFAASEKEILGNAEAISQNVGLYRMGRQDVLAYATATKALGIEAEVVGSTFQKTLGSFEKSIRSGKGLGDILKVVGGNAADLQKRFRENASGVFQDYVKGLNAIHKAGGSVNAQMEQNGITDIRQRRVIGTLAAGYDTLARAMDTAKDASGAMQEEFETASGKLVNQTERIGIAWDNLVLSIENGSGAIGKSTVAIVDMFATILESITNVTTSQSFREFFSRFGEFSGDKFSREISKSMGDIEKLKNEGEVKPKTSLTSYRDMKDFLRASASEQERMLAAQEEAYKLRLREYNSNKSKSNLDELNFQAELRAKMLAKVSKPTLTPGKNTIAEYESEKDRLKRERAEQAAARKSQQLAEQRRQATERQRALQLSIDQINEQSLRQQLSKDEQEVASIKDKYNKIREETRKFYADPKNSGLKVDTSGLIQAEKFELSEHKTRKDTDVLVKDLAEQKKLLDEYNSYMAATSKGEADKRYKDQLSVVENYRKNLMAELMEIASLEQSASNSGFTGSDVKLTQAQQERVKVLKELLDNHDKEVRAKQDAEYIAALQLAQDFNEERLKIEKKYQEARASLGKTITPEEDKELTRKENKEKSKLAVDQLQESDAWANLFSDLDNKTVKQIETLIAEIERQFDDLSVNFDPIDLAATRKKLQEAKDIIIDTNPFKAVGVSLQGIFKGASDDSAESAEKIRQHWTNLSKATNKSFAFIENAVNSAEFLGDALGETGKTAMSVLSGVAMTATAVATAIKSAEKASVVLAIIQAALVALQAVFSFIDRAAKRRNEELKREQEYYKILSDTFDILIDKQKQLFSEKNGKGALKAYQDAMDLVGSKQVANRKGLEAWFAQGASWKSHSNWYNYDKELGNVLSRQKLLNMSGYEWEDLLRKQPELWARLPEEVRSYAQAVIDAKGETDDLKKAIQEALTGVSLDDLRNEFGNLASMADLTFEDISSSFYKHMQKAVLRMIQDEKFSSDMKEWYNNFIAATEDENLTQAEADLLKQQYQSIADAQNARYQSIMEVIGAPVESSSKTLSKGIAGITETTANRLEAEFGGLRLAQLELLQVTKGHGITLSQQLSVATNQLAELVAIQNNTYRTANNTERLAAIEGTLVSMNNKMSNSDAQRRGAGL